MDSNLNQNLLSRLEVISAAASKCDLNFQNLENVSADIKEVSGFLGITDNQAVFFACLAELSFQKTVTLENLAKHLNCSVLKVIIYMNELEVLEEKRYIQKNFRRRGRKHSYNDMGFSVPHYVIEAMRIADAGMLVTATKFDLPGFLKQASSIVDDRSDNILLQALENFEGILIATTNLTDNLDKAFERRFTFKIKFPKPDSKARKKIWKCKLPALSETEAVVLGEKFEMTGGEIDVQIRQVLLKRVLNKKVKLFDFLLECCSKDHGFSTRPRIGF